MARELGAEMSRHDFSVAYDGEARRDDHSIDVEDLSPALIAFGRLIREANAEFNGKNATARVLVVSDFEGKCFNINFEVILNFYQHLKMLLGPTNVTNAKEILEWIGLLDTGVVAVSGGALSFLKFLKWKAGRKVENVITDRDPAGLVEVHIEGDGNTVQINRNVYNLSVNAKALKATRDAFLPLGHNGFDRVRIGETTTGMEVLDAETVDRIVASCTVGIEESKETAPEIEVTPAWLSVYSPVYDLAAPNWRFRLGKEVIYADITQTTIAQDAMERGGALTDDAYQVRLEITTLIDANGKRKEPTYKIIEVVRFVPAVPREQKRLF